MEKEKKEIGKLIELLNEYEMNVVKQSYMYPVYSRDEKNKKILNLYIGFNAEEELKYKWLLSYIVSLDYGFIKRLVENDKIDTSKANDKNLNGYEIELRIRAVKELVADSEEKTVLYLNLLMILAIQDEPIRFLCEILK